MAIGNYTDQQVKDWMTGKSEAEVAQQAVSMGLNADQIAQAYQLSGKNYTAADNGYSFNPSTGAAQKAYNPMTDPNRAGQGYGTDGKDVWSPTQNRWITTDEVAKFIATNPNNQQVLQQAQALGLTGQDLNTALKGQGYTGQALGQHYNALAFNLAGGGLGYSAQDSGHGAKDGRIVQGGGDGSDVIDGANNWTEKSGYIGAGSIGSSGTPVAGYKSYNGGYSVNGSFTPTPTSPASGSGSNWGAQYTGGTGSSSSSGSSYSTSGTPQMNLAGLRGATNMGVDPKTQTVAGQLETVLANDGPLIQQARTRALQSQNANGRLNSTMAQSAADSAAYDAAMAIATPDANTYNLAAQTNAATANTFSRDANAYSRQQDMANFNVNANNWAAQQEAARQAVRDAALNAQGVSNSATANTNQMTAAQTAAANQAAAAQVAATNAERESATVAYNNARAEFATKLLAITSSELEGDARTTAISDLATNYNAIIQNAAKVLGWTGPDTWSIKGVDTSKSPTNASAPKASAQPVFNLDNISGGGD